MGPWNGFPWDLTATSTSSDKARLKGSVRSQLAEEVRLPQVSGDFKVMEPWDQANGVWKQSNSEQIQVYFHSFC